MKLPVSERDAVVERILSVFIKLCGKRHCVPRFLGRVTRFQFHTKKIKLSTLFRSTKQ